MLSLFVALFSVSSRRSEAQYNNAVYAKAQSNLYVLDPPSRSRTTTPAVFRRNYKTAGVAPSSSSYLNTATSIEMSNETREIPSAILFIHFWEP